MATSGSPGLDSGGRGGGRSDSPELGRGGRISMPTAAGGLHMHPAGSARLSRWRWHRRAARSRWLAGTGPAWPGLSESSDRRRELGPDVVAALRPLRQSRGDGGRLVSRESEVLRFAIACFVLPKREQGRPRGSCCYRRVAGTTLRPLRTGSGGLPGRDHPGRSAPLPLGAGRRSPAGSTCERRSGRR